MDTQRLILFLIFAFSALFLWEAWQNENAPAPAPQSVRSPTKSAELPPPSAATPSGSQAPVPGGAAAAAGQIITIKTDLYTAEVDTAGGVITLVALDSHRDAQDPSKPYLALQKNAERTFVAQAGLVGEGMPNHRTVYQPLPGPRSLAAGESTIELKLQAAGAQGDKVTEVLTF